MYQIFWFISLLFEIEENVLIENYLQIVKELLTICFAFVMDNQNYGKDVLIADILSELYIKDNIEIESGSHTFEDNVTWWKEWNLKNILILI